MSLKVRWLGHAVLMFETGKEKIIVDPFLTGNPLAAISADEVDVDYVFVSHGHADHIGDTVEIADRCNPIVVANPEISAWLEDKGVKKIQHIQIGGNIYFPWGKVKMTYATHSSSLPDGSYGGNPGGFIFSIDGVNVYYAGDTGLFGDMKFIGEEGIDLAFLPIGDGYTMGIEDSLKAIELIRPKKTVTIHYDTFELIKQNPIEWQKRVLEQSITEPVLMQPGDYIKL